MLNLTKATAKHLLAVLAFSFAGSALFSCGNVEVPAEQTIAQPLIPTTDLNAGTRSGLVTGETAQQQATQPAKRSATIRPTIVRTTPSPDQSASSGTTQATQPEAPPEQPAETGPVAPVAPTATAEEEIPHEEMAAREHLLEVAEEIYDTLEVYSDANPVTYPVHLNGGSSMELKVRFPKDTHSTVSDYNAVMCTDFPLIAFHEAGYDLASAGMGIRTVSGMRSAFEGKANDDNILYAPQGGTIPPRIGDIVFMASHVSIVSAIEGTKVTIVQFNSRHHYDGTVTEENGHYKMSPFFGQAISGWGFYFAK